MTKNRWLTRTTVWLAHDVPAKKKSKDPVLKLRFTKTYDPNNVLPDFSFEDILGATQIVRMNWFCLDGQSGATAIPGPA